MCVCVCVCDSYDKLCKKRRDMDFICQSHQTGYNITTSLLCLLLINACEYVHALAHAMIVLKNMSVFSTRFLYKNYSLLG